MSYRKLAVALPLAAALSLPLAAAPAFASGGGGGGGAVKASGACSAGSVWKLKAKADNASIQVEAEVDTNKVGQTWSWKLADNGKAIAAGKSKTVAPSGSFTVRKLTANLAGTDRFTLRATNAVTGETCSGAVSF